MKFYIGIDDVHFAKNFARCFISVNRLIKRKKPVESRDWIMDSGAFTSLLNNSDHKLSEDEYLDIIHRLSPVAAVTQDYMCEPFILKKTGLTVVEHQQKTIDRYINLKKKSRVYIMPVLQGYEAHEYIDHINQYGSLLSNDAWVGVGSICKRNTDIFEIYNILSAIKKEKNLKIHGFGLKLTALRYEPIRNMLFSVDSMSWSYAARKSKTGAHNIKNALKFLEKLKRYQKTLWL